VARSAARGVEARLAALRGDPSLDEVKDALRSSSGVLIAAAARIAAERGALADELVRAFGHLLERPIQRDPGCRGTIAIARALHALERWDDDVFVVGVRHVQAEPGWGGSTDTAAELRGVCGLAHAHFLRPDALDVLAELLADRERTTRIAAARGLGDVGRGDVAALCRYKLLIGDDESEVVATCCESLFHLQREGAIEFAARLLERDDDRSEIVALSLGGSRLPGAAAPIQAWSERSLPDRRRKVGYLALALTREANEHLLELVRDGEPADAIAAARALATFKDDPALCEQVKEAARGRRERRERLEIEALLG